MNTAQHNPNILVTGGTGLVGAHLLAYLIQQGTPVRAIYRKTSDFSEVKQVFGYYTDETDRMFNVIEWVETDLLDIPGLKRAFEGISQVYHCAAMVSFDDRHFDAMRRVNSEGTANMVNLALAEKIDKFCYVSSVATLDNQVKEGVITEQNIWNPANNKFDYAITKYGGEMEVWRGTQEGLNAVIVNPGVILGSGFWHKNTGKIFTRVANGFKYYTNGITGYVGVWDVVRVMTQLMSSEISNQRFVLVSENLSYRELLSGIAKAMHQSEPSHALTPLMGKLLWMLDTVSAVVLRRPKTFTKRMAQTVHEQTFYDSGKIKKELLFTFEPMEAVIRRCVHDFNPKD
ncbi:MAG: NAD-dependent epimerase [Flavobacteriia bacterium]|nr:MAG: NAD-dependent epimerase [Flavobacteriia bacterium]